MRAGQRVLAIKTFVAHQDPDIIGCTVKIRRVGVARILIYSYDNGVLGVYNLACKEKRRLWLTQVSFSQTEAADLLLETPVLAINRA